MYQTTYHKASSLAEAASLLANADDGKLLAGGHTLLPTMKQRLAAPSDVIDVTGIADLKGIDAGGDTVTIGAATRHAEVETSAAVKAAIPALCDLAGSIGDPHVRNMGTLGGSIANADPAADYPGAVLGLGATVHTNQRQISADQFFTGLFETALNDDEIITKVAFPVPETAAYAKFPNPASRYSMTGVFLAKMKDGSVRVAVTGAGADGVFRSSALEGALSADWSAAAVDGVSVSADGLLSDIHASAQYRANLIKVMAKRAVEAA